MAGISPAAAGARMGEPLALGVVTGRVRAELLRERAGGEPLKRAFHTVARRLGLSARRVRAFHHGEVPAEDVTAAELLAADAAFRADLAALVAKLESVRGLIGGDAMDGPLGGLAGAGMARAGTPRGGEGGGVGDARDAVAAMIVGERA
jgi:hypothetical protein